MKEQVHCLLRIFMDQATQDGDQRVSELVLEKARQAQFVGVTISKVRADLGRDTKQNTGTVEGPNEPTFIEVIDTEERLREFMTSVVRLNGVGLMTLERIDGVPSGHEQMVADAIERTFKLGLR